MTYASQELRSKGGGLLRKLPVYIYPRQLCCGKTPIYVYPITPIYTL